MDSGLGKRKAKTMQSPKTSSPPHQWLGRSICFRARLYSEKATEWFCFRIAEEEAEEEEEEEEEEKEEEEEDPKKGQILNLLNTCYRRRLRKDGLRLVGCNTKVPATKRKLRLLAAAASERERRLTFDHHLRHSLEPPDLSPIKVQSYPDHPINGVSWAALASTIYTLGGRQRSPHSIFHDFSCDVSYSDLLAEEGGGGWNVGPPTVQKRADAKMVALAGKLYVFGGCRPPHDCCVWAEVLDPNEKGVEGEGKGQWKPLPSPTPLHLTHEPGGDRRGLFFAVACEDSNRILVILQFPRPVIYEYDVANNSWSDLNLDLDFLRTKFLFPTDEPVLVGNNMLYWVGLELYGYDLDRKMLFSGPIEDLKIMNYLNLSGSDSHWDDDDDRYHRTPLLHLGGDDFCLLWVGSHLHCTTFRVYKTTDALGRGCLDASVLFCQAFCIGADHYILDALLL